MDLRREKVLMLGWEFPPHNSGGLGVACQGLTKELAKKSRIVFTLPFSFDKKIDYMDVVACLKKDKINPNVLKINNSNNFNQELRNKLPFSGYQAGLQYQDQDFNFNWHIDWINYLIENQNDQNFDFKPFSWIEKKVHEYSENVVDFAQKHQNEFDVVHAHDWMTIPGAIKIKQKTKKPLVVHVHSTEVDRSGEKNMNKTIAMIEKTGMEYADKIIAVSYYTKKLLIEKYQIKPEKISVVHNGIVSAIEKIHKKSKSFAKKQKVVVFMGRLTQQKGPEYFIDLAYKLIQKQENVLFVVAGDGDLYQELILKAAGHKLAASVLFSGFVRGKQQEKLLDRADVFVMPSVSEPFGLVAIEAAKAKIPVVISNQSGVGEVLITSPQIDFWNTDKMASEVHKILSDRIYRNKLIKQQLKNLRKISWKKAALKIKNLYRNLIY